MSFLLACVLSSLFLPAACQFDDGSADTFQPDPLTVALFAVLCVFAFFYGVLAIWNFVALMTTRGHRSPYALLIPTIAFTSLSNGAYIARVIVNNIQGRPRFISAYAVVGPDKLLQSLSFVTDLFYDWAVVLQYLVILAILWNRTTVLRNVSDGKHGGNHPVFIALHATLAILTFIFGTAAEAYGMDTAMKYANFPDDPFAVEGFFDGDYAHRLLVHDQLSYVFTTFAILMVVDVAVTMALLSRAWRKAGLSDKITNLMLYILVPLYCIFGLSLMVFTILFSPSGLSIRADDIIWECADLAYSVLVTGTSITVMFFILALSIRKANWNPVANKLGEPQQYWSAQPQYTYASPPEVAQAGYYVTGHPQAHESAAGAYVGQYTAS